MTLHATIITTSIRLIMLYGTAQATHLLLPCPLGVPASYFMKVTRLGKDRLFFPCSFGPVLDTQPKPA